MLNQSDGYDGELRNNLVTLSQPDDLVMVSALVQCKADGSA